MSFYLHPSLVFFRASREFCSRLLLQIQFGTKTVCGRILLSVCQNLYLCLTNLSRLGKGPAVQKFLALGHENCTFDRRLERRPAALKSTAAFQQFGWSFQTWGVWTRWCDELKMNFYLACKELPPRLSCVEDTSQSQYIYKLYFQRRTWSRVG